MEKLLGARQHALRLQDEEQEGEGLLKNLTQLSCLYLYNTEVRGSLSFLENLTQLEQLGLHNTEVGDDLSFLQNLIQLEYLSLCNTAVSGSVLSLPKLRSLVRCEVRGSIIDAAGFENEQLHEQLLARFQEHHPGCVLDVSHESDSDSE